MRLKPVVSKKSFSRGADKHANQRRYPETLRERGTICSKAVSSDSSQSVESMIEHHQRNRDIAQQWLRIFS